VPAFSLAPGCSSYCPSGPRIFLRPSRHYPQRLIWKWHLQRERPSDRRGQTLLDLLGLGEDKWHGLGMDRRNCRVRLCQERKRSFVVSLSLILRTDVQRVQTSAKNASGRLSSRANQAGEREPSGCNSFSEKLVKGATQRFETPSRRRQCGEDRLRIFVTPGSVFLPARTNAGDGIPQGPSSELAQEIWTER
jgi:hypothetical protein